MKRIPYGIADFDTIIKDNFYYVDKTKYIKTLEEGERFSMRTNPQVSC